MNQPTPTTVKPKTARALFRAALRLQRQSWRNQVGRPPIPLSRQNRPWEPWEVAWLQVKELPSATVIAAWTGRSTAEVQGQVTAVLEEMAAAPEKKTTKSEKEKPVKLELDEQQFADLTGRNAKDLNGRFHEIDIAKETTMPKQEKPTNDQIRNTYHNNYVGRSESAEKCATLLGWDGSATFTYHCKRLGLSIRSRSQAYAAKKQEGQPWTWPDAEPATNTAEPTPVEAEAPKTAECANPVSQPSPEPAAVQPGPGKRAVVTHAAEFLRLPAHPQWPSARRLPATQSNGYHNPGLADLAHLVRDLREAGAEVRIALNIELCVGGDD